MNYIDLDWEAALKAKWDSGRRKHRGSSDRVSFIGDPAEELFQELIDAYHYTGILEQQGVLLPGYRTTIKNMALTLQQRRRELKRRIN